MSSGVDSVFSAASVPSSWSERLRDSPVVPTVGESVSSSPTSLSATECNCASLVGPIATCPAHASPDVPPVVESLRASDERLRASQVSSVGPMSVFIMAAAVRLMSTVSESVFFAPAVSAVYERLCASWLRPVVACLFNASSVVPPVVECLRASGERLRASQVSSVGLMSVFTSAASVRPLVGESLSAPSMSTARESISYRPVCTGPVLVWLDDKDEDEDVAAAAPSLADAGATSTSFVEDEEEEEEKEVDVAVEEAVGVPEGVEEEAVGEPEEQVIGDDPDELLQSVRLPTTYCDDDPMDVDDPPLDLYDPLDYYDPLDFSDPMDLDDPCEETVNA